MAYGWRYAFLIGLVVAVVGILLRLTVDEPSIYRELKSAGRVSRAPVIEFFRRGYRDALIALLLLAGIFWVAYATLGFLPTYLQTFLRMPLSTVFWGGLTYASLIGGVITIIGGVLSNVIRRKYAFLYYSLIGIILAYPLTVVLRGSFPALVVSAGILTSVMGTGGVMLAYLAELFPTRFRGLRNRLPVEHGLHRGHGSPTHRAILAQARPRNWLLGNAHRWVRNSNSGHRNNP